MGVSPYVRKVRFVLTFKGIEYDLDPVIPGNTPDDYKVFSPLGKIPAFKMGDFAISDSSVIAHYIENKFNHQSIFPQNPEDMARALWFDEYAGSRMTEILVGIFFNKIAKPALFKMPADMKRVNELEARLPEVFDYLENQVSARRYLVGEAVTLADFAVISAIQNFIMAGYEIESEKWPESARYYKELIKHPAIAAVLEKETAEMAQLS